MYDDMRENGRFSPDDNPPQERRTFSPDEIKRIKAAHKIRSEEKGRKNKCLFRFVWFSMVLLVALLLSRFLLSGITDMLAVGRESTSVTVDIPENSNIDQVAQALNKKGLIKDVQFFKLYSKLTKAPSTFAGGNYQISLDMDYMAIINTIKSSKNSIVTVKLTFREGLTAIEIADLFEKNGVCSAKDVLSALNSSDFDKKYDMIKNISNASERYYKLEGYLFPDTYEFYKGEKPEQAIDKLLDNCNKKLTKQIREETESSGMTVDQMMTLASMIQSEAADKTDMMNVSSVFRNRLASNDSVLVHLSSDPTIYYPYKALALVPKSIRSSFKSRYNTYNIKGLPPGPICSPGLEAISAAIHPADTDYYYFCHDKDGKAYYASTVVQHNANLKKAGLR
ncbi:MAG TPA: endolytic transglycosylase MltG [Ruminococcaceae bacterium]|nr:endolytic transglycosylase MltG [Oscillospiraceae bacterium]